jgi:hypothetical protein
MNGDYVKLVEQVNLEESLREFKLIDAGKFVKWDEELKKVKVDVPAYARHLDGIVGKQEKDESQTGQIVVKFGGGAGDEDKDSVVRDAYAKALSSQIKNPVASAVESIVPPADEEFTEEQRQAEIESVSSRFIIMSLPYIQAEGFDEKTQADLDRELKLKQIAPFNIFLDPTSKTVFLYSKKDPDTLKYEREYKKIEPEKYLDMIQKKMKA